MGHPARSVVGRRVTLVALWDGKATDMATRGTGTSSGSRKKQAV